MLVDSTTSSVMTPSEASNANASAASNPSSSSSTNAAIDSTNALGDENTFLTLLVSQIRNQDPTNPVDSTTFLTQLASFSSLEQLIGIRQDVGQLDTAATASATTTGTNSNSNS